MTTPENQTTATPTPPAEAPFMRTIKTYVLRAGRMGSGQVRAFDQFGPQFLVPYSAERLDVQAAFGRSAPLILEIGFGMGDATAKIAQVRPDDNFLCCEVHEPGVGALLKRCGEESIGNIRIVQHDAVEVMDHMLGTDSLDGVHIFFPDPWHKSRHHKRRLIQSPFVQRLAQHIKPGGYLHLATDWQPYAEQMLAVVSAEPLLANTASADAGGFATKPDYRPLTKFENRGLKLGHGVWDLVFRRV
ncbi:tRNA (guanosine(46)-N7)-methyltransferase TrmB [Limnohabitans sp. Jir72]|uniref:tRNA (guanosine(46)-N7)-methyltransferase TrmB n=1 Tax=Limnohabitans sp. Jir72 TaxID=1977909 RepID=UPI000D33D34D|nr:tRNA (guanosine(46)-N7)-methyltransferase TrmB [Limnohabitans sp. Jir72]PUE35627.1 tRNA (guanosine(46)-N7)-methyltransferase TrmB [Limnohabitans sp. Jir72]